MVKDYIGWEAGRQRVKTEIRYQTSEKTSGIRAERRGIREGAKMGRQFIGVGEPDHVQTGEAQKDPHGKEGKAEQGNAPASPADDHAAGFLAYDGDPHGAVHLLGHRWWTPSGAVQVLLPDGVCRSTRHSISVLLAFNEGWGHSGGFIFLALWRGNGFCNEFCR